MSRQPLRLAISGGRAHARRCRGRLAARRRRAARRPRRRRRPRGRLLLHAARGPDRWWSAAAAGRAARRRASRCSTCSARAVLGRSPSRSGPGCSSPVRRPSCCSNGDCRPIADIPSPLVVDLCTGSGALALAVAACRPDAVVHAVEVDPAALTWARRNIAAHVNAGGTPVKLHAADVRWTDLLVDLESHVDLVLCNPPYVPDGTPLPPEVAGWDPPDGRVRRPGRAGRHPRGDRRRGRAAAPRRLRWPSSTTTPTARPCPRCCAAAGCSPTSRTHHDLAGRPRFATARRRARPAPVVGSPRVTPHVYDCADPDARASRPRRRGPRRPRRRAGRAAHRHRLRHRLRRVHPHRRARAARGEGPRSGHAGAGARRLLVDDRRAGARGAADGAGPDRGVLAGRAVARARRTRRRSAGTSATPRAP